MVLFINSSSSRSRHFLWTSPFSPMATSTCMASNHVGRAAQSAGLADNNFGLRPFCVDNYPVAPEIPPGLSTEDAGGWKNQGGFVHPACTPPPKKSPASLQGRRALVMPVFLCTAGDALPCTRRAHWAGGGRGLPSPPRWPPCGPCACRPSPPCFMPMRCWPRTARTSKVFCCAGVRAA